MPGSPHRPARGRQDPNIVAMLSLYLLVLAFFILLNALSKIEEDRARVVMESVNEAFDGRVRSVESLEERPAALDELTDAATLIDELYKLFDSTIPATRARLSADAPVMQLELNADLLFRSGRAALQPGRRLLLKRLAAALLDERNSRLHLELELLHGVPADRTGVVAEAGTQSLEIARTGRLVSELVRHGLSPQRLSVGIAPGHAGAVLFVIRVFDAEAGPHGDARAAG